MLLLQVFLHQFFLLHHHDALYFHNLAIIAFPSFHAIWAMSIVVFAYQRKLLFYVLLVLNILVVISAVTLGWHYLADVLGAVIFLSVSLACARFVFRRYPAATILDVPFWGYYSARTALIFQAATLIVLFITVYANAPVILVFYTLAVMVHWMLWRE